MSLPEIDVHQLAALRERGENHVLLDVRDADEIATATLSNILHIPMSEIGARLDEIPLDTPIIVMCHHGGRSARVAALLIQKGRTQISNLTGGIDAWSLAINPLIARY